MPILAAFLIALSSLGSGAVVLLCLLFLIGFLLSVDQYLKRVIKSNGEQIVRKVIKSNYIDGSTRAGQVRKRQWVCVHVFTDNGGPFGSDVRRVVLESCYEQIVLSCSNLHIRKGERVTLEMRGLNESPGAWRGDIDRLVFPVLPPDTQVIGDAVRPATA